MNFKQLSDSVHRIGRFFGFVGYILATGGNGVGALAQQTVIDEIPSAVNDNGRGMPKGNLLFYYR